jgi:hypothetical protein
MNGEFTTQQIIVERPIDTRAAELLANAVRTQANVLSIIDGFMVIGFAIIGLLMLMLMLLLRPPPALSRTP